MRNYTIYVEAFTALAILHYVMRLSPNDVHTRATFYIFAHFHAVSVEHLRSDQSGLTNQRVQRLLDQQATKTRAVDE
ncbi:MAG: hypothetical protein C4289_04565, partial [Chloroflexota bacterium]